MPSLTSCKLARTYCFDAVPIHAFQHPQKKPFSSFRTSHPLLTNPHPHPASSKPHSEFVSIIQNIPTAPHNL